MPRYLNKLVSAATGRNVLVFLIPSMTVYLVMLFHSIPGVQSHAPGLDLFDLSPTGYSYDHAVALLEALGEAGREEYLFSQLPLDFVYPALFSISSFLLLAWLFAKTYGGDSRVFYFCYTPVLAGVFDYLENIQIVLMILAYPDISPAQVAASSACTLAKSVLTSIFFILLLVACIRLLTGARSGSTRPKSDG